MTVEDLRSIVRGRRRVLIAGSPEGADAMALAGLVREASTVLHVARDDARQAQLAEAVAFFAPKARIIRIPAWDCLPYDRVSPNREIASERVDAFCTLAEASTDGEPLLVLTTVNALLQRVPPRAAFVGSSYRLRTGEKLSIDGLMEFLPGNGYERSAIVREPGEYAVRGGLVDLFPTGAAEPIRIDLFGDVVERIRSFDPATQRSLELREDAVLKPVSEVFLDKVSIERFRLGYRELFGAVSGDPLYAAISEGRMQIGMEHWMPLFHDHMETLFDYLPDAICTLDHQVGEACHARLETIADFYAARRNLIGKESAAGRAEETGASYRPLPPERLYLSARDWESSFAKRWVGQFAPFSTPQGVVGFDAVLDLECRQTPTFALVRANVPKGDGREETPQNVFDAVRVYAEAEQAKGRRILIAAFTAGSRERLRSLLADHGLRTSAPIDAFDALIKLPLETVGLAVLGIERGFVSPDVVVLGEQDILGDRLVRASRPKRRAENFITAATELAPGDHVVHIEHGIGRYDGLETITAGGAPHDCLRLVYAGNDRLFVPVENVEVLTRYGSSDAEVTLDRLGSLAWQTRKSKLKDRLRDMANELIKIAAQRALKPGEVIAPPSGLYDEFCARFSYQETEDQARAIDETVADLSSGKSMDRMICGDVGFGKTEVALRAGFSAVMGGDQVAVICPTTLLCRQHFAVFRERFDGLPVRIEQLSRLVATKDAERVRRELASGDVDIVIGTHALFGKGVSFKKLGLVIVDEEQHFGVAQKEKLKQLKANVHVLTLTATPIPRTLQMALAGVKDMSVIATPPVDRLAVRTFVLPYDPVVVREAILREHFRGGQIFYVCPRIEDLGGIRERLAELVPEVKIAVAHGRMSARALEDVMTAFYERRIDLLLSTQIIESGLDIPSANTLIVHRADMFGLAQLYQLRGRVGRSKLRAYCYLTVPPRHVLTTAAEKRLEVMQTLDTLGAGFTLASHDLDIRGAGNLLGEEQSGHIREVGVELYQQLLEEAIAQARGETVADEEWTPHISIGLPVFIPEAYVADLGIRLSLYRRLANLAQEGVIEGFAAELIDRFGPIPAEVENLLKVVVVKLMCRRCNIDKIDVGPKGITLSFRNNNFVNPAGLVAFIGAEHGQAKLRADHKLILRRDLVLPAARLAVVREILQRLVDIAAAAGEPPAKITAVSAVAGKV